ncbi:LytR/AlgR family response regulator transcription factor [Limnochorda pilosa]|uniref:LytTR family transcriptional regulator n=1 Tax=Limnochorda pilosa TaxID=1555112 RepID=A0A0K2SFQ6_LIMPI|nr:LytTR family DNA-binding domain-containing protein [Limnochorda pilosa]BAS25925.1 LytTR family transcriptional regulator [Limnochorda pilosa]
MRRLRALVADDEEPARQELRYVLEGLPLVEAVEEASDAEEALWKVGASRPDVLLADVRMPGMWGTQLARHLRELSPATQVIFVTAYPDHAIQAFEVDAVDYIMKPLDRGRVAAALARALRRMHRSGVTEDGAGEEREASPAAPEPDRRAAPALGLAKLPVHHEGRTLLLDHGEIAYVQAAEGYSAIHTSERTYLASYTLNELEARLGRGPFFRCHRAYLVNLTHALELIPDFKGAYQIVLRDAARTRIPVSRRQAQRLKEALGL